MKRFALMAATALFSVSLAGCNTASEGTDSIAATAPSPQSASASQEERPNIVVILLDDMGYSDIGYFGSEIQTPNIDALARDGLALTQFYVYPRCSPTRAALMTGHYPHEVGLAFLTTPDGADVPAGPYQGYLSEDTPTIAERLKQAGYANYMSGKWHLGDARNHWPTARGFDHYFGLISGASSYYEVITDQALPRMMAEDDQLWTPPETGFFMTNAISDKAIDYLQAHEKSADEQPFFLYTAYTAPHWPLHASEEDIARYNGVYDDGWDKVRERRMQGLKSRGVMPGDVMLSPDPKDVGAWDDYDNKAQWIREMQVHAAMVSRADIGIGRIVETLRRQGELDNTLILVFSDNGASSEDVEGRGLNDPSKPIGARGSYVAYGKKGAFLSNTPLLDYKGSTHEGGIRSPLIVHWPKSMRQRGVMDTQTMLSVMDIVPTILSATGLADQRSDMAGRDVLPWLTGGAQLPDAPVYWEHLGWRAVRHGPWKAVSAPGKQQWQLYDISRDPTEAHDLSSAQPERLAKMQGDWESWSQRVGAKPLSQVEMLQLYQRMMKKKGQK